MSSYRLVFALSQQTGETVSLTKEQQHYLKRVLRFNIGDRFVAMNGQGLSWLAEYQEDKALLLHTLESEKELTVNLTLVTALPKGSGYEQILRCGTELGVSQFIPVFSDRSLLKPSSNKVNRWRKIVTEAAEQAERAIVPQVLEPIAFQQAIKELPLGDRFICVARGEHSNLWQSLQNVQSSHIIVATGAEGGWTESEIDLAISQQFQPVSLGKSILRAITAPISVATLVNAVCG